MALFVPGMSALYVGNQSGVSRRGAFSRRSCRTRVIPYSSSMTLRCTKTATSAIRVLALWKRQWLSENRCHAPDPRGDRDADATKPKR